MKLKKIVPNFFSILRILLVYPFILIENYHGHNPSWAGIFIIGLIVATDWADGFFARKFHAISNLGKILDPLADKIAFVICLSYFIVFYHIPSFILYIYIGREVILLVSSISFIRIKKQIPISNIFGKSSTLVLSIYLFFSYLKFDFAHYFLYAFIPIFIYASYTYAKRFVDSVHPLKWHVPIAFSGFLTYATFILLRYYGIIHVLWPDFVFFIAIFIYISWVLIRYSIEKKEHCENNFAFKLFNEFNHLANENSHYIHLFKKFKQDMKNLFNEEIKLYLFQLCESNQHHNFKLLYPAHPQTHYEIRFFRENLIFRELNSKNFILHHNNKIKPAEKFFFKKEKIETLMCYPFYSRNKFDGIFMIANLPTPLSLINHTLIDQYYEVMKQKIEDTLLLNTQYTGKAPSNEGMIVLISTILHTIGNLITSALLKTQIGMQTIKNSKINNLFKIHQEFSKYSQNLPENDREGLKKLSQYLADTSSCIEKNFEKQKDNTLFIEQKIQQIRKIISIYQTYSKFEKEQILINVHQLINEAEIIHDYSIQNRNIKLIKDFDDNLPSFLSDPVKLIILFSFLIRQLIEEIDYSQDSTNKEILLSTQKVIHEGEIQIKITIEHKNSDFSNSADIVKKSISDILESDEPDNKKIPSQFLRDFVESKCGHIECFHSQAINCHKYNIYIKVSQNSY